MPRVRLVSWKPADAEERAALLRSFGHEVDASPVATGAIRELPREEVDAFVVDLDRLPSQGRDVGVTLRRATSSRHVPLVFAGGAPEKVERVRELLPDAAFAGWDEIGAALERAIASPPPDPVVPDSNLAAYASTPLPKKLGIKEGSVVCLVGAPDGFSLDGLPAGAVVRRRGSRNLTMVWVRSAAEAERVWDRLAADEKVDDVWIVWAKKTSALFSGVTQANVREPGMARGFVDFKVCAIDETWTALRFKRRR
jgi:CheY-like chemotaxis protein